MLKKLLLIPVVCLLLLIMLPVALFYLPASLLPKLLDYAQQQGQLQLPVRDLQLAELAGTLWQGQGRVAFSIEGITIDLGRVNWQLDYRQLFARVIAVELTATAADQALAARVQVLPSQVVKISNAEGYFPVSRLEPWVPLLFKGQIVFFISEWQFNPQQLQTLEGVINLDNADWLAGDYAMPLGSFMAQLTMQQQDVLVRITDIDALLGVDGELRVSPARAYNFKATLMPRPGLATEVTETLRFIGRVNTDGSFGINQRGRF